jgi:hypothetical protein
MPKKSWKDLSPRTQRSLVALGVVEMALLAAAQVDLTRRSGEEVRGSKTRWRLISLINVFGPLAYFFLGRRTPTTA